MSRPSPREPAAAFWALGIGVSVALHATGVAGAVLLADRYVAAPVSTEITFTEESSPVAEQVKAEAEAAAVTETASAVIPDVIAPAVAEVVEPATEAVQPIMPETAGAVEQEQIDPAATVEAAEPLSADTVQPPATEPEQALPSSDVSSAEAVMPETAEPAMSLAVEPEMALPAGVVVEAEQTSPETIVADVAEPTSVERLETPEMARDIIEPIAGLSQEIAGNADTAEQIAAVEQPAEAVTGTELVEPLASSEVSTGAEIETAAPATEVEPSGESAAIGSPEIVPGTEVIDPSTGPTIIAPIQTEQAPEEHAVETALLVPARPDSSLGTEIDKPSDRYRRIVDFIRGYDGGDCFIALPAMNIEGNVTFQTFGRDKPREDAFRRALLSLDGLKAEISGGNVADSQCLALAFAQRMQRYPGFSLMIDLDEANIASGASLSGSILNANGRDLHLLLIDDEGTVQSVDRFLARYGGADLAFSAPLVLTGGPVETKQILIAITADAPLPLFAGTINEPAESFFPKLAGEILAAGADIDLAVEGFSVK